MEDTDPPSLDTVKVDFRVWKAPSLGTIKGDLRHSASQALLLGHDTTTKRAVTVPVCHSVVCFFSLHVAHL